MGVFILDVVGVFIFDMGDMDIEEGEDNIVFLLEFFCF